MEKKKTIADLIEDLIYEVKEDNVEFKSPRHIQEIKDEIDKVLSPTQL
jgi:2-hydroxy-3-keto-5-methylthiopentenyl-1-phosphate phosphatase